MEEIALLGALGAEKLDLRILPAHIWRMHKASRILLLAVAVLAIGLAGDSHEPTPGLPKDSRPPQQEAPPDWWIIGLTGLLAAATIGLWLTTRDLVKGAERTAERQLRAYVFAESARIRSPFSNKGGGITVTIKNFGQTPAYKYAHSLDTRLVNVPSPTPLRLEARLSEPRGSVAPGGRLRMSVDLRPFTRDERIGLEAGTKTLYVFGEIRYIDAFGAPRFSQFRYQFGGHYGAGEGDLSLAEQGNEAN